MKATKKSTSTNKAGARKAKDEALLTELANFKPLIDDAKVEELERIAGSKGIGQSRRLALVALSRDAEFLSNVSIDAPDVYREMLERVENFASHAEGLHKAATSALLRLKVADCRRASKAESEARHG